MSEINGRESSKLISRADLLRINEVRYAYLKTQINGLRVRVKSLTALEHAELDALRIDSDGQFDNTYAFADLVIATVVDEDGDPMFGELDRLALMELDSAVSRALQQEIMQHVRVGRFRTTEDELKKSSANPELSIRSGSVTGGESPARES